MDLSALLLLCLAALSVARDCLVKADNESNATKATRDTAPVAGQGKPLSVAECNSYGRSQCNSLKKREETLRKQGIVSKRGSYMQSQDDKLQLYHLSLGVLEATAAYRNGMGYGSHAGYESGKTPNTFTTYLLNQGYVSGPYKVCAPPVSCNKGYSSKYRTYDGSCNSQKYPRWGQAKTAFNRLLPPAYSDGVSYPRKSVYGDYLPSARLASAVLFDDKFSPDELWTVLFMQFGQFLSHDMSMAPSAHYGDKGIQCCNPDNSGVLPPQLLHHACYPIIIPYDDPFFSYFGQKCMNFVRTMTVAHPDCRLGPAEQMNAVSHFIDLSQVYGNSEGECKSLRVMKGGLLAYTYRGDRVVLPVHQTGNNGCTKDCPASSCYKAGDSRVNQNLGLSSLHILFLREHNRIASDLYKLNPKWDDEYLFQETRRIMIAIYQNIVYNEYLPIAIGWDFAAMHNIINGKDGEYNSKTGYNDYISPNIINEHATAAFRYQHSTVHSFSELYAPGHYYNGSTRMSDHYECPAILEQGPILDYYIRGMCTSPMQKADKFYSHEITWFLFREGKPWGLDLESFDFQRTRDHGLKGYNDYRGICGLPRAKSFDDLTDVISPEFVKRLSYLYKHVDDLDLTVAFLETHVKDALFGPTLRCIVGEQFYRSRVGDRFFFEHKGMPHSFSDEQLASIKKTSLARLVCSNSDYMQEIQPEAFHVISGENKLVNCDSLPSLDLSLWKDY